jgi:ubiquitin-conjugating enzyme E2 M
MTRRRREIHFSAKLEEVLAVPLSRAPLFLSCLPPGTKSKKNMQRLLEAKKQKAAREKKLAEERAAAEAGNGAAAAEGGAAASADSGADDVFTLKKKGGAGKPKQKRATAAEMRVQRDVAAMDDEGKLVGTTVAFPDPDNLMEFTVCLTPRENLWKDASFMFRVKVPQSYPHDPPRVDCETPIYHPNINEQGNVCLNILRDDWRPVMNLRIVLFGLMTLFVEPNPDDPLNQQAADTMVKNNDLFKRNVQESLRGGFVEGRHYPKLL